MTAVQHPPSSDYTGHGLLPKGFQVQIDLRCARGDDLHYLIGGSPTRLLRMSDQALGMTSADGRIEVSDEATGELARRLLDAGIAHPRPMAGPSAEDVTVVIPVCDNQAGVDRLLRSVSGCSVVVVDDGSATPIIADDPQVRLIRLETNQGPSAARNAGAALAGTDYVAFLDSDVVPRGDWLTMLLGHFSDPTVAVSAPRIVGWCADGSAGTRTSLAQRYENGHSALDMGPIESAVSPGTRIPYVPSAAMVVRRSAFGGFDESLRVAEDVDLCWRLHKGGWRIRYDPVAVVAHEHRAGVRDVLARRRYYGTGAAPLASRHGTVAAPLAMSIPMAVAVAALLTRTKVGAAVAMIVLMWMGNRLRGRLGDLPDAPVVAAQLTARALGHGMLQAAAAVCRHYWPVAIALALFSARFRRLVIELALVEGAVQWVRVVAADPAPGPGMGPLGYLLLRRLDDLAYGAGLWQGVVRDQDLRALRPVLTR